MTADSLQQIVAQHRRELLLEATQSRLAATARAPHAPPPGRSSFAAALGQLLAARREALSR